MMNPAEELPAQPTAPPPQPAASQPAPPPAPTRFPVVNDPRRKSPVLATVLSVMPGLGQIYVGYYKRGFVNAVTVAVLITLLATGLDALTPLAALLLGFFWLYNLVDAGRSAALYNQALAGGAEIELPRDFPGPGLGGSIAGGATLMVIGLVLLSHTAFGASLAWLENWWPLALIGFGGYLVVKAMRDKASTDNEPLE